jgi:hypothetical protein
MDFVHYTLKGRLVPAGISMRDLELRLRKYRAGVDAIEVLLCVDYRCDADRYLCFRAANDLGV